MYKGKPWAVLLRVLSRRLGIQRAIETVRVWRWRLTGRQGPPPHRFKIGVIRRYRRQYGLQILVETGTYLGDTVAAVRHDFRRVISIELDHRLAELARRRFASWRNVEILEGDSAQGLPSVLATLEEPALFWLDAHYSAGITARGATDSPIVHELSLVLEHPILDHVVLIDDARHFNGSDGYPWIAGITALVRERRPTWEVVVADDIIRVQPR